MIRGLRGWTDVPIVVLSVRESRAGQGRSARRRRRRLRDEAVRDGRAARTAARRPAPGRAGRRGGGRRDPGLHRRPRSEARHDAPASDVRLTPTEWAIVELLVRNPGQARQRSVSCCTRSGARSTGRRRTTCASTWRRSGASSSPTRPDRGTSSPSRGWGTASSLLSCPRRRGSRLPPAGRSVANCAGADEVPRTATRESKRAAG